MLIDKRETQLDRLITFLKHRPGADDQEVILTPKDQDRLNRFIQLRSLELRYNKSDAIVMYEKLTNISKSQAYRDYAEMQAAFGNAQRTNKEFRRELQLEKMDQLAREAREKNDLKTAAMLEIKIFEWTVREESEAPFDPRDIQRPIVVMGQFPDKFRNSGVPKNPKELQALINKIKTPKTLSDSIEDIDFTESTDE